MANRVERKVYENKSLVIQEFISGEVVEVKSGENLVYGDLLIFDNTSKKYVKYVKATHKTKIGEALLRVYNSDKNITVADEGVVVVRQGRLNKAIFKGIDWSSLDADDYKLIAQLERLNIILEEVK